MEVINWHRVSPTENPFGHLWLAKCALFSELETLRDKKKKVEKNRAFLSEK